MEFAVEKSGERLDKFLASHMDGISRTRVQRFIQDGSVSVNGARADKSKLLLKAGDRISISEKDLILPDKDFKIEPDPEIPLEIVYEDKDILVINKQSGLLIHPTINQRRHTLVNALVARYPNIIGVGDPSTHSTGPGQADSGQMNSLRPGIVHRLDKDTSGLMVIAKNQDSFLFLKEQFSNRTIQKTYLALVEGIPQEKEGVIRFQIRPSKMNRMKKVAVKNIDTSGKRSVRTAETRYKLKESYGDKFSLIEVMPKTGRTHQIRVHLSAIGCPVVGDHLYRAKNKIAKRQMLHAYKLELVLPNGKSALFEVPIPKDMQEVISSFQKKSAE